jgi:hypothetical protein
MIFVLLCGYGINKNIMKEYSDELVQIFPKSRIHQTHEYFRGIGQTNRLIPKSSPKSGI